MTEGAPEWLVGIDVGASGARARAVGRGDQAADLIHQASGVGAPAVAGGAATAVIETLERILRELSGAPVAAVAVGATGLGTMTVEHAALRAEIAARCATDAVVIAADAVTAHVGALGGRAGVTVAAGTGAIAIADDGNGTFSRVDGWGHLLGDRGSAAWIGRAALDAALAAFDGRSDRGADLLGAAAAMLGPPLSWPSAVYGRDDRAAVLGTVAPIVDSLAAGGDAASLDILMSAAVELAASARACLGLAGVPAVVAHTGGVFASEVVRSQFAAELADSADVRAAEGSPLDGAVALADRRLRRGRGRDTAGLVSW